MFAPDLISLLTNHPRVVPLVVVEIVVAFVLPVGRPSVVMVHHPVDAQAAGLVSRGWAGGFKHHRKATYINNNKKSINLAHLNTNNIYENDLRIVLYI